MAECGTGTTLEEDGSILAHAPKPDVRRWSTSGVTRFTRGCRGRHVSVTLGTHLIRKGCVETDKGQPGKAQHTREGGSRRTSHATALPLQALKMVLSEIATGGRGRKVVALVDVRRAHFDAPSRRRVSKYHQRTLRWENAGCCSAACTAQGTPRRIGRRSLLRHSVPFKMTRTIGSGVPRQDDSTEVRDQETSDW